jgi:hypothetical protein
MMQSINDSRAIPSIPRSIELVLILFGCILLLLPKINLIDIPGSRAGIRVDDLIIAALFLMLLPSFFRGISGWLQFKAVKYYALFVIFSFFGAVASLNFFTLLFPLRYLEYAIFLAVGYSFLTRKGLLTVIALFVGVNMLLMTLQYSGYIGGYTLSGYTDLYENRVVGTSNHPSEIGLVLCIIFGYCLGSIRKKFWQTSIVLFILFLYMLLLTGSRMPIIVCCIIYVCAIIKSLKSNVRIPFGIFVVSLLLGVGLGVWKATPDDNVFKSRFSQSATEDNMKLVLDTFTSLASGSFVPRESATGSEAEDYSEAGIDASLAVRMINLQYVLGAYLYSGPIRWVLGVGPGYYGSSTDLGYVRLWCELGVIGFFLYMKFMWSVYKISFPLALAMLAFAFNMLTLDAYQGYKIMAVLLMFVGYECRYLRQIFMVAKR